MRSFIFIHSCLLFVIQIRLLFNRKNKTLRSVLKTKATFKLLEENRQTLKSLNNEMNTDESVGDILERIFELPQYKDKRARNMNQDEFLQLLADFNEAGIHFSS
jgi:18S rRNA (adenine1779-N6/adenine1780-N6)-dimethyltransferase